MFPNLENLITAKQLEVEGLGLLLSAQSDSSEVGVKVAGNLTAFLDKRKYDKTDGVFVTQLNGSDIPAVRSILRKEREYLSKHPESHKFQALVSLLDRWEKFTAELSRIIEKGKDGTDNFEQAAEDVLKYISDISSEVRPGNEDNLLREFDVVVSAFERAEKEGEPAVEVVADRDTPVPHERYMLLMNMLNQSQHKFS